MVQNIFAFFGITPSFVDLGIDSGALADFIQFNEFRALLCYMRQYFEYWVMFTRIDTSSNGRINIEEFSQASVELKKWGVDIQDPVTVFHEIDVDGCGQILFDEFANWAITHSLDLEEDNQTAAHRPGAPVLGQINRNYVPPAPTAARGASPNRTVRVEAEPSGYHVARIVTDQVGSISNIKGLTEMWHAMANRLPTGKTPAEIKKRGELFKSMDLNGNGFINIEEVERGVLYILGSGVEDVFNARPVLLRAFAAVQQLSGNHVIFKN